VKVLLVGNYALDRQPSMLGFAGLMKTGLQRAGHEARILSPPIIVGRLSRYAPRFSKWFAYLDKLALFPPLLRTAERSADIVHICDHSNALYIPYDKLVPHVVTCHDLLAVRGSLGEETDCSASFLGKWLQKWISGGLTRADTVACVSSATLGDFDRLFPGIRSLELLPLALRYDLKPITKEESLVRLRALPGLDLSKSFVLHVGSSHPRKNREGVLRIFAKSAERLDAQLVIAGKQLTASQQEMAERLGIADRVVEAGAVSNELLAALYGRALAFLFPSRFEGFGWPIIEAQSCGCPVVCSNRAPFPEVAGDTALMRDVEDEGGFSEDIIRLAMDKGFRSTVVQQGLRNVQRYSPEAMTSKYVALYTRVIESSRGHEAETVKLCAPTAGSANSQTSC
jgi:glycosyltransferase involved in cell wall biosynthesis